MHKKPLRTYTDIALQSTILDEVNNGNYIYVLELMNGKFYIGQTTNLKKRINEHRLGRGASWTNKYPPKKIVEIEEYPEGTNLYTYEDDKTIKYILLYGLYNVRGGQFTTLEKYDQLREYELAKEIYNTFFDKKRYIEIMNHIIDTGEISYVSEVNGFEYIKAKFKNNDEIFFKVGRQHGLKIYNRIKNTLNPNSTN